MAEKGNQTIDSVNNELRMQEPVGRFPTYIQYMFKLLIALQNRRSKYKLLSKLALSENL